MTLFGVHTGLQNTSTAELTALWPRIESMGFDWISVWDHFYAADLSGDASCLEAVAAHTALAMCTERVEVGCLVYCVAYRSPAVLAKAVTTIDHLSGGRAAIGLGAGWAAPEFEAFGYDFAPPGQRLDLLEESAGIVRDLLHSGTADHTGRYLSATAARNEPMPVRERLPVWIGGGGERRTLRIAARLADGWNVPFVDPATFAAKRAVLHRHCREVGRDPAEIRCAVNVGLSWDEASFEAQFGKLRTAVRPGVLMGSETEVVDRIGDYVEAGADQVNIALRAPWDVEALERLAAALGLPARV